jgi:acetoin utilization deacetylase AcuC-like enzyme
MHGEKNFPFRKEASSLDIDLPDQTDDTSYLTLLQRHLPALLQQQPISCFTWPVPTLMQVTGWASWH